MFFFLALYMQDVLGYSPLEAGIRFLPSTVMIVLIAPIAGRLTDKIGARWLITVGLSIVALALYGLTTIGPETTYADIMPGFIGMGAGIALTMSPMSTAAMNAVEEAKAGIASGLLSMMRMVGGTFGVAATGALFQSRAGSLDPTTFGADPAAARAVFVDAMAHAMRLSAAVALIGALIGATLIKGRTTKTATSPETRALASEAI
jgi:predicted MFS family arabinose efflux permease